MLPGYRNNCFKTSLYIYWYSIIDPFKQLKYTLILLGDSARLWIKGLSAELGVNLHSEVFIMEKVYRSINYGKSLQKREGIQKDDTFRCQTNKNQSTQYWQSGLHLTNSITLSIHYLVTSSGHQSLKK